MANNINGMTAGDATSAQPATGGEFPEGVREPDVLLGHARGGAKVMLWGDYGIVCPDLVTTNGSLRVLMRSWGRPLSLTAEGQAWFIGMAIWCAARMALGARDGQGGWR